MLTRRVWLAMVPLLFLMAGCGQQVTFNGEVADPVEAAPPLVGTNWDGAPFELTSQQGKVAVVFFGYTFCPDVCPFTLAKLKQVVGELGDRGDEVAVVFVSVDPHRDSIDKLSRYVPNFDSRFYGLRLEFDELDTVQEDWGVTVQYGQPKDGPGTDSYYYVDHTGTFFVIDREGQLRLTYPPNVDAKTMVPDIEALLSS